MKGRKPLSNNLKSLTGSRRRRSLPAGVPGAPDHPEGLGAAGKSEWDRLVSVMADAGTLSPKYRSVMIAAAHCVDAIERCRADIDANGTSYRAGGLIKRNPALAEMRSWLSLQVRCLESLGLTPSSNQRVQSEGEPMVDDAEREFFGDEPLKLTGA
ncbi:MAG: P27 family phage terminase small subunit [Phycisphaerales bacterium]|nr:P27 family phage terminase small subunit [Phycisphaerales bacterium]